MVYSALSDDALTISQFTRREEIKITTTGSSTPANYQQKLTITYAPEMQANFNDIRFNTKAGGYIDYWIESKTDSVTATIWVELPNAIADPGSDTIRMYYGNGVLGDGGDGDDVFELFDDFDDSSLDAAKWGTYTEQGSPLYEETGGYARIYTDALIDIGHIYSLNTFSDVSFRWRFQTPQDVNVQIHASDVIGHISQDGERIVWASGGPVWKYSKAVSGSWSDIGNVNHDTTSWWIHEMARVGTLARMFQNNVQIGTDQTVNAGAKYLVFRAQQQHSDLRVDWAIVRKYIANEPTTSYGTPQHQHRTPQFIN